MAWGGIMVAVLLGLWLQEKLKFGDTTFALIGGIGAVVGGIAGYIMPLSGHLWIIHSPVAEQILLAFLGLLILFTAALTLAYNMSPAAKTWVDRLGGEPKNPAAF